MSCCTTSSPGTPTFSSGYTARLAAAAKQADQARVLARLRATATDCCPTTPSNKAALYASVLEQDAATRCQPSPAEQALRFPRQGVPESVRIQRVITDTISCSVDPLDPNTRFSEYRPFLPPAPCPAPTAAQLNSTTPKPTFWPGCTPVRYLR